MNYQESIHYLYGLTKEGIKLGLENINRILELIGSPQQSFKSIHIAGTNGKGSTASMIASMLSSLGYKTGLFTSPHLVRFTERIRVDNREISEDKVVELTEKIKETISGQKNLKPTFFEFITAMAFLYFQELAVDYAVVETGMGGRFDATNVLQPEISVITPVDFDHMEFLGNTLPEIAFEKAGIIKESTPVVIGSQQKDALHVLVNVAEERNAQTFVLNRDFRIIVDAVSLEGTRFHYISEGLEIRDIWIPLAGVYQAENASLAIKTIDAILEGIGEKDYMIKEALDKLKWSGRFEVKYFKGIPFILDGAHNPRAVEVLTDTIKYLKQTNRFPFKKLITIIGTMSDKDIHSILSPVVSVSDTIIVTAPSYNRALSPLILYDYVKEISDSINRGIHLFLSTSLKEAIELSMKSFASGDIILVTGSFYTVGDAKIVMGEYESMKYLCESN
ncbi:MAG: bifunctional folylpolyglutamate synthase/dihydrofolate synthase [Nitrospirae bacterium]|nr:bifunctional folylpolyglutamate synthase/dihydrofolate synthase [Nitrospirota bacterium]